MLINLLKSPMPCGDVSGKVIRNPCSGPDHNQKLVLPIGRPNIIIYHQVSVKSADYSCSNPARRKTDKTNEAVPIANSFAEVITIFTDWKSYVRPDRLHCKHFCRATLCISAAVMWCLSVRLSVRPSRSCILSKRIMYLQNCSPSGSHIILGLHVVFKRLTLR